MSGSGKWDDARRKRLERQRSKARNWISQRIDTAVDRLPPSAVDVIERLRSSDVLVYAGGLAFYSLVSIVPTLLLLAWMTGSLLGEDRIERLAARMNDFAPGEVDIEGFVRTLLEVGTGVGVIALVAAIWPATAFGGGLVRALDALSVDADPALEGLRGRARALVVLIVLPLFVFGAFGVGYVATGLLGDGGVATAMGWLLAVVGGTIVASLALALLYWWFGPAELTTRSLAEGAAVAAAGLAVMSLGYLVYLSYGTNWEERVAGTGLAAVVLLCLWLYLANLLLLAGYCVALAVDPGEHRPETSD